MTIAQLRALLSASPDDATDLRLTDDSLSFRTKEAPRPGWQPYYADIPPLAAAGWYYIVTEKESA